MLRNVLAAVAAAGVIGVLAAPVAAAQPKFCEHHGTGAGEIYIHACAVGPGGAGPITVYKDPATGEWRVNHTRDPHPTD